MRSFWVLDQSVKGVLTKYLIWTGPQKCPTISHNPEYHMYYKKQSKLSKLSDLKSSAKRNVFLFSPVRGSITVETALVLPLFMFFCIQLISLIGILQLHSAVTAALHQEVSKLSLQAYAYEMAGGDTQTTLTELLGSAYLKERAIERAGREYLDGSMIENGSRGFTLFPTQLGAHTGTDMQDEVGATLCYRVKPVVDILGFSGFSMASCCYMKAWTGYRLATEGEGAGEEELVYITENGTVYHKSRNCSHLALSVREVETDSLGVLRNDSGSKYYPCEHCGKTVGGQVFLTDQGNRYHSSLLCSGLKRTIYIVKLSETGGMKPCSRCANMG